MSYRSSRRSRSRSRSRDRRRSRSRSRDRRRSRSRSRDRYARRDRPARGRPQMDDATASTTTNLFVGNLPFSVDDRELREMFAPFGEVTRAVVGTDRATGRSKGFGFIAYAERKAAAEALAALAGKEIQGRILRLDWDPGLDARGPGARAAGGGGGDRGDRGGVSAAPYEKRRSPSPKRGRSPRSE